MSRFDTIEASHSAESRPDARASCGRKRPLLRRVAASRYLVEVWGVERAPATFAKRACTSSCGPPFYKAGRWPLYDPDHLDAWARRLLGEPLASTSAGQENSERGLAAPPVAARVSAPLGEKGGLAGAQLLRRQAGAPRPTSGHVTVAERAAAQDRSGPGSIEEIDQ
jgi:hypothetical protein